MNIVEAFEECVWSLERMTQPMTKDKIQDQKFIIYKAIRYLMSDISMQYHTEMNSVYYDQHFKLCTDKFFI